MFWSCTGVVVFAQDLNNINQILSFFFILLRFYALQNLLFVCLCFVENYERLEADKKKQVHKKRRFEGPTIRYHSVLMPLVSQSQLKEENVDVEGCVASPHRPSLSNLIKFRFCMIMYGCTVNSFVSHSLDQDVSQTAPQNPSTPSQQPTGGLCSRTFITFSDDEAFDVAFPRSSRSSPQLPVQEICPVTHKAALYRDPVTDIPYANARAFRIIREAYRKYVAAHGFPNTSGVGLGSDTSAMKGIRQKMAVKQTAVST